MLEKNATKFNSIFQDICTTIFASMTQIFIYLMCDNPRLNSKEFESEEENSTQCDKCNIWVHWGCSGVTKETDVSKNFVSLLCKQVIELKIC